MEEKVKIKIDFDDVHTKSYLDFITDTQEGKYTNEKPDITQVTYKRILIQEQSTFEESNEEFLLFGVSY